MPNSNPNFKEYLEIVYASKNFSRLKDIIGFTGLGADFSREYINEIAVYNHDVRVAEVCKNLTRNLHDVDSYKAQFISLTHDYSAFPFRHFAMKGALKDMVISTGYNAKARNISIVVEEGIEIDEKLAFDLLNFDINEVVSEKLTMEGKLAIACESAVTVFEDICFGLKYEIITFEMIPDDLLSMLNFPEKNLLESELHDNCSRLIEKLSLHFCEQNFENIEHLLSSARALKLFARSRFIVDKIFKEENKQADILKISQLYDAYRVKFENENSDKSAVDFLNDLSTRTESYLMLS